MKLAVSGKGGVGKSTLAGAISLLLARRGRRVLAVDADPDANLALELGMPPELRSRLRPISEQAGLIEERTGAKPGTFGQMFSLTPYVADIADKYAEPWRGVSLLAMGGTRQGGGGCACPENALLKVLVQNLVLERDEDVVMDMEAGIEHLGRGTAQGVDAMLAVAEPGLRACECALQVEHMCGELGLRRVVFVGNKVRSAQDEAFLRSFFAGRDFFCALPWSDAVAQADRDGLCPLDAMDGPALDMLSGLVDHIYKEVEG